MKIRLSALLLALLCAALPLLSTGCGKHGEDTETFESETETTGEEWEYVLPEITGVHIPEDSTVFSKAFADEMLTLAAYGTTVQANRLFSAAGFTVLLQKNFDKTAEDPSHTSAYTVGKQRLSVNGVERNVILIAIRGTNRGEWYSNIDMNPKRESDPVYAGNFYAAAQDVVNGCRSLLAGENDPVILVTGQSRGGAVAGLVGAILDETYPVKDVYVYTFASPTTVRGSAAEKNEPNIFNLINPCDVVTMLPLEAWGFTRPGTDIRLAGDAENEARLADVKKKLETLVPTLRSYYEDRHQLTAAGLSDDGMSTYELIQLVAGGFAGVSGSGNAPLGAALALAGIAETSDFYPLVSLVKSLTATDQSVYANVALQHTPARYQSLLRVYSEK